jgi:transposase
MAEVMIGIDPHKSSHTAVAIGQVRSRWASCRCAPARPRPGSCWRWAREWPERAWAIEGAAGLGNLLAQQLVAAGERVLDVPPKLAARVRLLQSGNTSKNDPDDAYSAAVAALRSKAWRPVVAEDHAVVLKIWAKRHRDLARARNQACCRLHAVLCDLVPGGIGREISAGKAAAILEQVTPSGPAATARRELAAGFLAGLRRLDAQLREARKKLAAAVKASGTSLTGLFGAGPVIAGTVIGDVRQVFRFPDRDHFAAWTGTAPVEVSSGDRKKVCRLSLRGNRRVNHAIHMAAISQIRHQRSDGRAFYDKKAAEGKTGKEALRALKRRISDAIYAALVADARQATACPEGPGGQPGNHFAARAAGSHPGHRHFGQATPRPRHHTTAAAGIQGRAGHSPIAATLPPAKPQVQVERPQRSEDERPGGAARRQPYSATRKAPMEPPDSPLKPQLRTNPRTTA